MSQMRETCGCGAEWEGGSAYVEEREKFRAAHARCREVQQVVKNIPKCPDCKEPLIFRLPHERFMEDDNYVQCVNGHVFELVPPPPVEGLTAKELIKQIGDPKHVDQIQITIARLFLEGRLYAEDFDPDTKTTTFTKVSEIKEE